VSALPWRTDIASKPPSRVGARGCGVIPACPTHGRNAQNLIGAALPPFFLSMASLVERYWRHERKVRRGYAERVREV